MDKVQGQDKLMSHFKSYHKSLLCLNDLTNDECLFLS